MPRSNIIVVGGGIAGSMTALSLQRRGEQVTLIDRWEPGHPRAASTDYNRVIRAISGRDEFYTRWARESRMRWLELMAETGQKLMLRVRNPDSRDGRALRLGRFHERDVRPHGSALLPFHAGGSAQPASAVPGRRHQVCALRARSGAAHGASLRHHGHRPAQEVRRHRPARGGDDRLPGATDARRASARSRRHHRRHRRLDGRDVSAHDQADHRDPRNQRHLHQHARGFRSLRHGAHAMLDRPRSGLVRDSLVRRIGREGRCRDSRTSRSISTTTSG